jgi:hypothetical protein
MRAKKGHCLPRYGDMSRVDACRVHCSNLVEHAGSLEDPGEEFMNFCRHHLALTVAPSCPVVLLP